jgi:hypothetical protein
MRKITGSGEKKKLEKSFYDPWSYSSNLQSIQRM